VTFQARLTSREISAAIDGLGWRFVLGTAHTSVPVRSLAEAAGVAADLAGLTAGDSLLMDVRADRLALALRSPGGRVTAAEVALAGRIAEAVAGRGLRLDPGLGGAAPRTVQSVEIAIDALDIPRVRPFWRAVMAYADEPDGGGPADAIVDPLGQGPAIWFQQMSEPRPQRNRIHLDVSVPHDEAEARIEAALAAGGHLVSEAYAPAFWVLADAEGNEVCVCTWQGRD
jgi:4a-hydroxytetrahydrobiopterin dehydratase